VPSTSKSQKHLFAMVKAVQHGHQIEGLSKAGQAKVHQMAERMSPQQVNDFMKMRKGAK